MIFNGVLNVAPRVITPMIDLPFTRSESFSMEICAAKLLAVFTRSAAGRACMPARLRIVTMRSTMTPHFSFRKISRVLSPSSQFITLRLNSRAE